MPANANKVPCPICKESKRVGDHIKSHIYNQHRKQISAAMRPVDIDIAIKYKLPMMWRKKYPNGNDVDGDYCVCLICKDTRYARGHGEVGPFFHHHKTTSCMTKWNDVALLFGDLTEATPTELLQRPTIELIDEERAIYDHNLKVRDNKIKLLEAQITAKDEKIDTLENTIHYLNERLRLNNTMENPLPPSSPIIDMAE